MTPKGNAELAIPPNILPVQEAVAPEQHAFTMLLCYNFARTI